MTIVTAAASLTAGTAKTILTAALLAHPAPAVAEWTQASDGPVFETTKTSVNRQPDKAVFLRPKVSPKGGVVLPARMDTRLVTRFQHPAHPMRMKPHRVAFCCNQEPETMKPTPKGQSAQDPTPLATVFGRSLAISSKGGVTITDHNARPRDLLSRRAVQLQSLLILTTDVEEFGGYADEIQGGILGLAADLANDIHLIVHAMDSSAEGAAA